MSTLAPSPTPKLDRFLTELGGKPFFKAAVGGVQVLADRHGEAYLELGEDVLRITEAMGRDPVSVFGHYIGQYVKDRRRFEKSGSYDNGTFDEIRERIYDNASVMLDTYLPGLFLANVFTSICFEKFAFFQRTFVGQLETGMTGLEVGYGDGFHLLAVLRSNPALKVHGLDISPHAKAFATEVLHHAGIDSARYRFAEADARARFPYDDGAMNYAILTEVIEHVDDAAFTLSEVRRVVKPGGTLFLTTVIDANHMDHILNFEGPEEVVALLAEAGFETVDQMVHRVADEPGGSRDKAVGLAFIAKRTA